jgi:sec-independent protein translocase protein TatC
VSPSLRRRRQSQFERASDGSMPLMEHLRELRSRLFKACLAILAGFIISYWLLKVPALNILKAPYCEAIHASASKCQFTQLTVTEFFVLNLKISLYLGLIIGGPVWLYQLWAFIAPGLHKHERKWAYAFAAIATPLFITGAVLAYLVVHRGLEFLLPGTGSHISTMLPIANYVGFIINLMMVFGLAFEFPLVIALLNVVGIVSARRLLRWWRIAVFLMFVIAAFVTPTPDPFGMSALALPMVALYFAAVGFAFLNDRRRAARRRAEGLDEVGDDEASPLSYTSDPVDELEPVAPAAPLDDLEADVPHERARRSRRFDDST